MSVCVMDDWKLSVTPVVRLERPNKTFVLPLVVYPLPAVSCYSCIKLTTNYRQAYGSVDDTRYCTVSSQFAETRFAEIRVRSWCLPDLPKPDSPKPVSEIRV